MIPAHPPAQPLTEHLEHWAAHRGVHRAFSAVAFPDGGTSGTHRTLTWNGLRDRARTVAAHLTEAAAPGERVALLLPQGLDYVTGFLGCLYAGTVAVPLFTPELAGHEGRLAAVLADCAPACLLTDSASLDAVRAFAAAHIGQGVRVLAVDTLRAPEAGPPVLPAPPGPDGLAYLQYTSGSTRTPAGVEISHGNVVANARQALTAYAADRGATTTVGWLPLFHDMGLVLSVAAPVVGGFPSVLMDPVAFLEEPVRWLRLLARHPGAISAAPNFAYDYCSTRVGAHETAELRLHRVKALINGSEPVRPGTMDRFAEVFAATGLRPEALCPSYGLAEATVFVTADALDAPPARVALDRDALSAGKVVPVDGDDTHAARLVTCGAPVGQRVRIVDPDTGSPVSDGEIGEIRVRGPNVGGGYWNRPVLSAETFASRVEGEDGPWLRTGDLGALHEGALLVTGRLKDLVIVDGRNHYPQDIEETVQTALPELRRDRTAVFTVPSAGGDGPDALVVVAEHRHGTEPSEEQRTAAAEKARAAVSSRHGLRVADFRLLPPGAIPRTSSGKVARTACRARYVEGSL